ncbi:glycosyltransferase [Chelatococcus reniformis]|uniref:Glycosyl transferase n=1 Tax=Chelatococcus reniformis TaxID=1494448 RepID=A0A916XHC5_9HYPH|nr:glycosyltransferase [Chelatococcus reniformis]GGC73396.1 glycosyl transferase [Chelatococcus reniformis]
MRIVMSVDTLGGGWTRSLDLARALAPQGVETTFAILGPQPTPAQDAAMRAVPGLKSMVTNAPIDWLAADESDVEAASHAVARFANIIDPDIVHLGSPLMAGFGHFHAPTVVACDPSAVIAWKVDNSPERPLAPWRHELTARGYDAATALVAATAALAERTAEAFDLPRLPAVVPSGRRPPRPGGPAHPVRDFALVAAHAWDVGENIWVLNRAAGRTQVPLMVAGPREHIDGSAVDFGNLWSLGPMPEGELARWLEAAPVFVSSALCESECTPVLEAAHMACALVLSDRPTFRETWNDAAVFVDPGDDAGFAHAIDSLIGDPDRCRQMAKLARQRALTYTAEARASALLGIYQSVGRRREAA